MRWTGVKRGGTRSWWRVLATGGIFTSARPKLPERNGAVGGMLIDMLVTAQARIDIGTVERRLRREAVDTAAAHEEDQIDPHVAFGADFAFIARLAQDTRGGEAAAVAKPGDAPFDQLAAVQHRDPPPRVLARFAPHRPGHILVAPG